MRQILRQETEFEPSRRDDADWVFLVALPQQARQIKPTLAFNFAGDLPVYATSHLYSGEVQPNKDRDLNGIIFVMPLATTIQPAGTASRKGRTRWPRQLRPPVCHGRGCFPFVATAQTAGLLPYSQVFGSTGSLHLDAQRRIAPHRLHPFAQGQPRQLSGRQ